MAFNSEASASCSVRLSSGATDVKFSSVLLFSIVVVSVLVKVEVDVVMLEMLLESEVVLLEVLVESEVVAFICPKMLLGKKCNPLK